MQIHLKINIIIMPQLIRIYFIITWFLYAPKIGSTWTQKLKVKNINHGWDISIK